MASLKEFFDDIMEIEGVEGVIFFSNNGEILHKKFKDHEALDPESKDWWGLFIYTLDGIEEADFVFKRKWLYIRKANKGYLFVLAKRGAPVAMIRLNCDIILPNLKDKDAQKGWGRFFRRNK